MMVKIFLAIKYSLIKVSTLLFRQCYWRPVGPQYNVNITSLCPGKPKHFCDFFIVILALPLWSGIQPIISPRSAWS